MTALARPQIFDEIDRCTAELAGQTGSIAKWIRPSQIDVPDAVILHEAGRAGYPTSVGYDIDPLDYTDPGATLVTSRVRARLHSGAIVSLHSGLLRRSAVLAFQ